MPRGAKHGHLLLCLERRQQRSNDTGASPLQLAQVPGIPAAHKIQLSGFLGWAAKAEQVLSLRLGPAVAWELLNTALLGAEGRDGTPHPTPEGETGPHIPHQTVAAE